MKDKNETKEQLIDELAEMRQRVAELGASETERKQAEQAIPERRIWLPIAGIFILLCILVWLNEIVDLPHLLLGAPQTPINWREAIIEMVLIASVGLFAVLRLIRDITEQVRTEEEIKRRNRELAALNAITAAVSQSLDLKEILGAALKETLMVLNAEGGFIYLFDETSQTFTPAVNRGISQDVLREVTGFKMGEGLSGRVAKSSEALVVADLAADPRNISPASIREGWHAYAAVPINYRKTVLGVMTLVSRQEGHFKPDHVGLLSHIGNQIGLAIENARLYEETRRRALEQETVSRIAYALNTPDVREAFPVLVEGLQELTSCDMVSLIAMDEAGEQFIMSVLESPFPSPVPPNLGGQGGGEGDVMPLSATAAAEDIEAGRPHLTADLSTETHFPLEQALYQAGLRSRVTLPLLVGGEVFGALNLDGSHTGLFREDQLPVLQQIADAVALALENSLLFQTEREQRDLAEALEKAAAALTATLDFDQVLDCILEQVSRIVPNDATNIMLIEGDQTRVVRWRGYERFGAEEFVSTVVFRIPEAPGFQQMMDSGEPMAIPDTVTYPGWVRVPMTEWLRSYAAAPIIGRGEVIGFLNVDSATPGLFTPAHAEALRAFADHAAAAIENARLYEEIRQRALQQETLREAALALTTALDRNEVIERILAQLQQVVPYDSASVQLLREDQMELVGGRGFPNLPDLLGVSFPVDGDNPNSEVIRTRAPFIVEDAPAMYEEFRTGPHMQTVIRSWLGVPMLVGERLVGMIALDKSEPGFYTQEHARLAEAFAAQAAVAIENARLFEEERRRATQLALINKVGEKVASILDSDRLMQEVTCSIQESFNYYNVALFLLDEERREVVMQAVSGGFEHIVARDYSQSLDEGIIGFVGRTGKSRLANDIRKAPCYVKGFLEEVLTKSELCVPIKLGNEVIGALDVQSIHLNDFDQEDVAALEAVADRLAMGIQNARLYEEMAGLYDVGLAVTSALELDKTLRVIYEQVNHLMSFDTFYIALYDEARGELRFDIFVEEGEWLPKFTKKLDEGGLTTRIVQSKKPLFIGDFEKESPPVAPGQVGKSATQSWLGFPLLVRDKVVGVISVQSSRPHAFTKEDKRILSAFANQAAVAIENARLYEQVTRHVKALSTLHEISQELTSTLEPDQVLQAIAENTIKLTGAARSLFLLIDAEAQQMVLATGHGYSREHLEEFTFEEFETGLSGWVRRERKPALVADAQTDARQTGMALQHAKQHGSRSLATAPLWIKGEVVGTLTAVGTADTPAFTDETLELVVMLANQAAIAIENARLYEETQRRSQEVATLNAIVQALNASLDVRDVFQVVATELKRLVEFDRASIALTNQALQNFTMYALMDQPDAPLGAGVTMPIATTAAGQDALAGRLHLTEDLSAELDFPGERLLYDAGLRSRVIVPLMVGERLIGSLNLASTRPAAFSDRDLGLLQQVAGAIAAALENARLFEETEHLKTFNENVVQSIAEAILIEDAQGVFTFANPAAGELLGYTREELIGRHWTTIVAEEQVEKVQQELTKRPHGIVTRYETVLRSKEGQVIPVIVSGRPLLEEGKFVGVLSAFTDIRERVRAEREIEERRVYLEGVLGAAPDAIVSLDARHRIVEWNTGAVKLFGYSREEAVGQDLDRLITRPDVFEEAVEFTQVVMAGMEVPPIETVRYRKDGSPVDVLLAGSPILVEDELIGVVAVYTDITARKRMEETLRALALLDDLTGLYNRRGFLALGQQQLKTANRAKRRMVLLFADVNGLKRINDTFGHPEGDRALIETADVLRETFRESDVIARIGGDEFVVLAIETNGAPAEILAARLQEKLEARNAREDRRYKLSLSVGLARYDPERPCSIDELLARADRAMYEQKRGIDLA